MENPQKSFNQFILNHAGIPKKYRLIEFDDLTEVHPDLIKICKQFIQDFPNNKKEMYLFSATPGNAKSSLASCILKGIIKAGKIKYKASFISCSDVINFLRQKIVYGKDFSVEDDIEKLILRSEFLVMDDIGKHISESRIADYYFQIINKIYENEIPTIWTSNYSTFDLGVRFDADEILIKSMCSRFEGMCMLIELTNRDFRLK